MNFISTSLFLAAVVATSGTLQAEDNVPVAESGSGLNLTITTSSSISGSNKMKDAGYDAGKLSSKEFESSISGRIPLGEADSLGVGTSISYLKFDHGPRSVWSLARSPLPKELNSATLDLSWTHRFNAQWSSLLAVNPGVHWADSKLGSDAFGVQGVVGALYQQSPTLNWMFGVAYDSMSHDYSVMPAVGVKWSPSEHWTLAAGFPRTAVSYHVSPVLTFSLVADGRGSAYHVTKDPYRNILGESDHTLNDSTLEYFDARVGIEADYRFSDRCSLTATVGSVLYREAKYHKTGIRVAKFKSDDDASAYGSLGLKLAF